MLVDWNSQRPILLAVFGIFMCCLAAVYAYTGKLYLRFQGWVYLDKEPKRFWWGVAEYFLCGLVLIGYYFWRFYPN
jgi:hypothetical protein